MSKCRITWSRITSSLCTKAPTTWDAFWSGHWDICFFLHPDSFCALIWLLFYDLLSLTSLHICHLCLFPPMKLSISDPEFLKTYSISFVWSYFILVVSSSLVKFSNIFSNKKKKAFQRKFILLFSSEKVRRPPCSVPCPHRVVRPAHPTPTPPAEEALTALHTFGC